jgi:hypothetical protein
MTQVNIQSIRDSVQKGNLIELSSDYRTSGTIRAYLPDETRCAMSATAFRQHVLQGKRRTNDERGWRRCVRFWATFSR